MNGTDLTVTAIITTYGRKWNQIERAIKSVLNQSHPVDDFLLIDDNPEDSPISEDIRHHICEIPQLRYIPMPQNSGVGAARNYGLHNTLTDLVAYLDDDDEWLPQKVEKQLQMFRVDPDVALTFGIGIIASPSKETKYTWSKTIFKTYPSYQNMLQNDHVGSASHPMIKTSALRELGGFKETRNLAVEDYELWIRISQKYKIMGICEPLYIKHMEEGEHVSRGRKQVYLGYIRIYREFYQDYQNNSVAKKQILRNIVRTGVKGYHITVLPYIITWVVT